MKYKQFLTALLIAILALIFGYPNVVNIVVAQSDSYPPACESWDKTFGGNSYDSGSSVQQTSDGGYILLGKTPSYGSGETDIWLIKTDDQGNQQWSQTFGGSQDDHGESIQQTSDGGYILLGYTDELVGTYGAGEANIWLIKTDAQGSMQWERTFDKSERDLGYSVQQTSDGGYILVGPTGSYGGEYDIWLIKVDAAGNKEWDRIFGGEEPDRGFSVQQTRDGGYILLGFTESFGAGNLDAWLIKTDADGNKQWDKTYGGSDTDTGHSVQQTDDGGYILLGWTYTHSVGQADFWLIKTDANGNMEWDRTFGGSENDYAEAPIQQTRDGGYILLGSTRSFGAGEWDFWLIKTDANGDRQWDKTFGGSDSEAGYAVQETRDGGYILLGYTVSYNTRGGSDVWLIKYCPEVTAEPPVSIPDENLAEAIRNVLGKPLEEQIYRSDLESMEELLLPLQEIRDLTGLQYAVNLRELDLWSNEITDISVLIELPSLAIVDLEENLLDISPGSKAMEVIQALLARGVRVDY